MPHIALQIERALLALALRCHDCVERQKRHESGLITRKSLAGDTKKGTEPGKGSVPCSLQLPLWPSWRCCLPCIAALTRGGSLECGIFIPQGCIPIRSPALCALAYSHAYRLRIACFLGRSVAIDVPDTYREFIQYIGNDDPTTRRMIETVLASEEEHAEDLSSLLGELGKKGEPAKDKPAKRSAAR